MESLKNKIAVIAGASSGIGEATALAFAREGASVVVNYRNSREKAESIVAAIQAMQGSAVAVQADMSSKSDINHLIQQTISEYGRVDIWINNAGADILTGVGAKADVEEKLEQLIEVDLKGTIHASWLVSEQMQQQGQGVIVNTGWDLSIHGLEGINPQIFAATKAGILGFTRSLAKTIGPAVRVNAVLPGWIATAFAEEHMSDDYYKARTGEIPLGRFGKPEDVAAAVLFLASDAASYLCGEGLKVNGGLS